MRDFRHEVVKNYNYEFENNLNTIALENDRDLTFRSEKTSVCLTHIKFKHMT